MSNRISFGSKQGSIVGIVHITRYKKSNCYWLVARFKYDLLSKDILCTVIMEVTKLGVLVEPFGYESYIGVYMRDDVIYFGHNIVGFLELCCWYHDTKQSRYTKAYHIESRCEVHTHLMTVESCLDMIKAAKKDGTYASRVEHLHELEKLARDTLITTSIVPLDTKDTIDEKLRIDELIDTVNELGTFKEHTIEASALVGVAGIFVLGLKGNAAIYDVADNIGAAILSKMREYRKEGISTTIIAVWSCASIKDAQQLLKRIDMFVEQHSAGFTCPEGRFINLAHWDKKQAAIDKLTQLSSLK